MLKNKDNHVKELAIDFKNRFGVNELETILFIRRLNVMGYVVVKGEDLKRFGASEDKKIKKTIVPWLNLLDKRKEKETDN